MTPQRRAAPMFPVSNIVPSSTTRATLYTTVGRDAGQRLTEEEARLQRAYLKQFKRPCKVPIFFSNWDSRAHHGTTIYALTAHATPEQAGDLEFLRQAASPSQIAA